MKIQESIDILSAAGFRVNKHIKKNKYHIFNKSFTTNVWTKDLMHMAEKTEAYLIRKLEE